MSTTQGAEPGPSNGDEDDAPTQLVGDIPPGLTTPDESGHYLVVVDGLHPGRRMLIGPAPVTIGARVLWKFRVSLGRSGAWRSAACSTTM